MIADILRTRARQIVRRNECFEGGEKYARVRFCIRLYESVPMERVLTMILLYCLVLNNTCFAYPCVMIIDES